MAQSPEEVRRDIEETRDSLGRDVDALNEKVSPGRIARRRLDATKDKVSSLKERVMGSASDSQSAGRTVGSAGSSVADAVTAAPDMARRTTEGNPLAAGLVAFAAGWLVASVLPASKAEQQAAQALQDKAGDIATPAKQQLSDAANELKDNLQPVAQEAVDTVKQSASDASWAVKEQTSASAQSIKQETQASVQEVKNS